MPTDHADDYVDRKNTSGICTFVGHGPLGTFLLYIKTNTPYPTTITLEQLLFTPKHIQT